MDDTDSLVPGRKNWLVENKWQAVMGLFGVFLLLMALGEWWKTSFDSINQTVLVEEDKKEQSGVVIDVSGAVNKPGVYSVNSNSRLGEAIEAAGGLKAEADVEWVSKTLNLAQTVKDGMKIYVPHIDESKSGEYVSDSEGEILGSTSDIQSVLININTASQSELVSLWGIGESRASTIIENRPYENIEQITSKAGVPNNVFEKIKGQISVY